MIETERKSQCLAICRDLRMPELDGMGLYEELAQHYPHLLLRLIFLTGDTLNADLDFPLASLGFRPLPPPSPPPSPSPSTGKGKDGQARILKTA
jgi:hypothetical protein